MVVLELIGFGILLAGAIYIDFWVMPRLLKRPRPLQRLMKAERNSWRLY